MKNVLKHSNGSQSLLANVDDDTNRIFINDAEIPSSLWVGSGTYTQSIDGVMISITKISDLSGNIMLQKVSDNHYQLVRKTETASIPFSHIGQIIESTTLDSLDKVQAIYGSNTMWIQHTGYILRGASSGVNADNASNDGGADSYKYTPEGTNEAITLTAAQSGVPAHSHPYSKSATTTGSHTLTVSEIPSHKHTGDTVNQTKLGVPAAASGGNFLALSPNGAGNASVDIGYTGGGGGHTHTITLSSANTSNNTAANASASHNHTFTGKESTHNNLPKYKNVYIWERTA